MAYKDYIPGAEMAGKLLDRGKNKVVQKGKEVARKGASMAIDGITSGVRIGLATAGFIIIVLPAFAYRVASKKH